MINGLEAYLVFVKNGSTGW